MTDSNQEPVWGFHLNETLHSISCLPCPNWANSWERQNWHKLGVVVWDAQIKRIAHLHGSQAVDILEVSRQSESWKKEGLLVGEVAYQIAIPSNKKSKRKTEDQPEQKISEEDGWCLTNTIQLTPDQAQVLLSFLGQQETILEKVVQAEAAERKRILGQVYSLILGWRDERKKGNASVNTGKVQESKTVANDAISIPRGKYLTIAQVAEICSVREKTVSDWLSKGVLKGLELPGLGQIIEEKALDQYLAKKRTRA
ncbi:MAG: helix-turn-helix domain-containing protein [Chloroflexota bacterium]